MRGALKNTVDMRALQFELQVATHLAKSGFDLGFPQAIGASNVDILAVRNELELEVECKFISIDKGRSVHRREALEIHHLLKKRVFPVFANASVGILIRVQFHERPPKKYKDREALVDHIRRVALGGTPGTEFGCSISTVEFDVGSSPFSSSRPTAEAAQEFFGGFGVRNRETAIFANIGKCVLAISLESEREDDLLGQVFDTVADAATRQLSGDHPGVICVKFEDLPAAQLKDIADENGEPTPLRIAASRFLDSASAKNVSMLSFFADDRVEDIGGGVVTRAGSVYSFPRPVGEFHKAKELEAIFTKTEK
jgi:hypothetical protein